MFRLIALMLVISFNAHSYVKIKRCSGKNIDTLNLAHEMAIAHLDKAYEMTQQEGNALVVQGLKEIFQVDYFNPEDKWLVDKIHSIVKLYKNKVWKTRYKCGRAKGIWCYFSGAIAIVPPPMHQIIFCPKYFDRQLYKQAGIIVHEWGHRYGFWRRMGYINEKYCWQWDELKPKDIARQPDAYMMYIDFLARDGQGVGCFKHGVI